MSGIGLVIDRSGGGRVVPALTGRMADALASSGAIHKEHWGSADKTIGFAASVRPLVRSVAGTPGVCWDADHRVAVIFNGSLFNYYELRAEEENEGTVFETSLPEEVILSVYKNIGTGVARLLDGMFSLIILDFRYSQVLLIRDSFGKKPFYFYDGPGWFAASSEMCFLMQVVPGPGQWKCCHEGLSDFLIFGYNVRHRTIVENIKKVMPGEMLVVSLEGTVIQRWHYWTLPAVNPFFGGNIEETYRRFKVRFDASVERELEGSETGIDILLSGGVDSTAVFCSAVEQGHLPNVFTLRGKNRDCGSHNAVALTAAAGMECIEIPAPDPLTPQQLINAVGAFDEPFCNADAVGLDVLAMALAKEGRRAALSGDGGNELMIGYNHYRDYLRGRAQENGHWWSPFGDLLRQAPNTQSLILNWAHFYNERFSKVPQWMRKSLLAEDFQRLEQASIDLIQRTMHDQVGRTPYDFLSRFDYHFAMPDDILFKIDRIASRHSLEFRTPMVDHDLAAYMVSLPENVRIGFEEEPKWMLRRYIREHGGDAPWVANVMNCQNHAFHVPPTPALQKIWDRVSNWVYDDDFLWWTSLRRYGVEQAMSRRGSSNKISRPGWIIFVLYLWWRRFICNNPVQMD